MQTSNVRVVRGGREMAIPGAWCSETEEIWGAGGEGPGKESTQLSLC